MIEIFFRFKIENKTFLFFHIPLNFFVLIFPSRKKVLFLTQKFLNSSRFAFGGIIWRKKSHLSKECFLFSEYPILELISPWKKCQSNLIFGTDFVFRKSILELFRKKNSNQFVVMVVRWTVKMLSLIYLKTFVNFWCRYEEPESKHKIRYWT